VSSATATLPSPPGTSLGAAVNGPDGCRPPGFANAATLPHPSPSTAPVRPGLVPQCGQEPGTWGDTPRPVALSHSGRRRAVLTSRWPWASDGPSAEQRIVGSHRHWRPQGCSVGAGRAVVAVGGSPSAPYTLGAGRQCSPARLCAVSWAGSVSRIASGARLRRPRGHWAGRSQSAIGCTPGGGPRTAIAQCSRARWPVEPGRTSGQVARPRAACLAAHQAARPVA
jgi:hypothetical protein